MLRNMVVETAYVISVAYAAISFDDKRLLVWWLFLPAIGYSYKRNNS